MSKLVYAMAIAAFSRNIDGQIVVGHPEHPEFRARYFQVSKDGLSMLVEEGQAREISRQHYRAAQDAFDAGEIDSFVFEAERSSAGAGDDDGDEEARQAAAEASAPKKKGGRPPKAPASSAGSAGGAPGDGAGEGAGSGATGGSGDGAGQALDQAPTGGGNASG